MLSLPTLQADKPFTLKQAPLCYSHNKVQYIYIPPMEVYADYFLCISGRSLLLWVKQPPHFHQSH